MTLEDAIIHAEEVAESKKTESETAEIQGCDRYALKCEECAEEHRQLAEWLRDYKRLKEQEPCEDEYIKVPKKALKYRTAEMVAYNAEWLKNHFDMERDVICGVQQPCEDAISRQAAVDAIQHAFDRETLLNSFVRKVAVDALKTMPSVKPQEPKTGHWKEVYAETDYRNGWIEFSCENCGYQHGLESGEYDWSYGDPIPWIYCPICGARMSENPTDSESEVKYADITD